MTGLFDPFTLKDVTLRNRIAVPPMTRPIMRSGKFSRAMTANSGITPA